MEYSRYGEPIIGWIKTIEENRLVDPELTLKCCKNLIDYATEEEDIALLGFGYYYCGEIYYCLNDGKAFFDSMNMAVRYLDQGGEWELMAKSYNFLGIKAMSAGNVPLALEYYSNGLTYATDHQLEQMQVLLQVNLGSLYYSVGRYQWAQRAYKTAGEHISAFSVNEGYHDIASALECNRIKTLVALSYFETAIEAVDIIHKNHWAYIDALGKDVAYCAEAILYHEMGDIKKRNEAINKVSENISPNMSILDCFDDYYDYATMLLETDQQDALWQVIDVIEPLVKDSGSTGLMLKVISLKIKYYRKTGSSAEYLKSAGLYYELSELRNKETLETINKVINLRQSLDAANQVRREVEAENRRLMEKSERDALTKIANRFRLNDYSEEIFQRAFANQFSFAVCIMDVDYFKQFNDNYGHQAGDECLVVVANTLKTLAAAHDGFCARYGGDEFVAIFPGADFEKAKSYAAELKSMILEKKIEHKFSKCIPQVSLSQGWCVGTPVKSNRMWDFMHAADENLYNIKQVSRNNYKVSDLRHITEAIGGEKA